MKRVFCNNCAEEIKTEEWFIWQETWGYYGVKDMRSDQIDLCQHCYTELCDNFKIKPWSLDE